MKAIVDVPKYARVEELRDRLRGCKQCLDVGDFTITPYPEITEVPMVRTGTMSLPKGYDLSYGLTMFESGDKVDLSKRPELEPLCTDITESIDWDKVPLGAVVMVEYNAGRSVVGFYHDDCTLGSYVGNSNRSCIHQNDVKSVKILAIPEVGK